MRFKKHVDDLKKILVNVFKKVTRFLVSAISPINELKISRPRAVVQNFLK